MRQANGIALRASQQDSSGRKVLSSANIAVHGRQLLSEVNSEVPKVAYTSPGLVRALN